MEFFHPAGRRSIATRSPPGSWTFQKSEVEGCEYQDDSYIHRQPLPEVLPEEQEIYSDHNDYQEQYIKYDSHPATHFRPRFKYSAVPVLKYGLVAQVKRLAWTFSVRAELLRVPQPSPRVGMLCPVFPDRRSRSQKSRSLDSDRGRCARSSLGMTISKKCEP